jgi:hypothetical protein
VVGNPPHVSWEALTPEWRKAAEEEYKHYGLFTLRGLESRHGGGKKDIAALFTYAVMDHFVKNDGVLALVVHVSLFKTSGAGEGYRRFKLGDAGADFCIEEAHDLQSFQPFQTYPQMKIKTRTLIFRSVKGRPTKYPVLYTTWKKVVKGFLPGSLTWDEAQKRLESASMQATPLRGTTNGARLSPWLTVPASKLPQCRKVIAPTNYQPCYEGHAGIYTGGLNGAYFLEVLDRYPNGTVLIRNMHDVGKIKCPQVRATLEADLVYPLLRGRSLARWSFKPEGHVLIVQDSETQCGYPESWMQETHPLTWSYLKRFEKLLRERKAFKKFFDPSRDPFYSMYDISHYTFEPYKVAWMDISATVKAAAIVEGSGNSMPMPEHTVMFLTTDSAEEAYYVTAVLNSDLVNTVIAGYIVDNHLSTHPVENIVIPKFDPTSTFHTRLASLSRDAHLAAAQHDQGGVMAAEMAVNQAVRELW